MEASRSGMARVVGLNRTFMELKFNTFENTDKVINWS